MFNTSGRSQPFVQHLRAPETSGDAVENPMAVSNELSSEIAAAVLANTNRSSRELKDLQEVILRVHSILRQMDQQARADRIRALLRKERRTE
jgi:hypothetical protein